jgi:hypothetical protein
MCSDLSGGEGTDRTHGNIVPKKSALPRDYYFAHTPEEELVDWDDSDLKYRVLPPKRPWDVSRLFILTQTTLP